MGMKKSDQKHKLNLKDVSQHISISAFSDVNLKLISPSRRRDLKKLQQTRYAMIAGFLMVFIFFPLIVIGIPLFLWGLYKYKELKPKLERDLAPYRNTRQPETDRRS